MNSTFTSIMRIVLGLALLVFGLNKFLNFIKMFEMPPAAANFMESLETTGYVFYIVAIIEISVGLMLLFKKWVPFALVLLAPLTVNILLFHLFLDVSDIAVAIVIFTFNVILIYKYWKAYRPLFQY
ncbi:DoxX family membrane protein [Marinirhabdus gelatinilytica]|uniref:DoxX-like protein n=1 Tax=Marinirhabdus gelatinilytica TaxID=1703343 RepID=A0A370QJB9_9FLAO|nr:DoxX family membrane protein [Marinirhabdus gelatinilytica]RDK88435.1 DoxX-like protein [Marinirhabdus gelatinilytica]